MFNRELLIGIAIGAVGLYLLWRFGLVPYGVMGSQQKAA